MVRKLLSVAIVLISASAFAQEGAEHSGAGDSGIFKVNQNLTPVAGENEIFASLDYLSEKEELQGGEEITDKGFKVTGEYYYGLDDNNALGAELNFVSSKYENTDTASTYKLNGIRDLALKYKANWNLGFSTLYYSLGYALELQEAEINYTSEDATASKGQNAFLYSIGMIFPAATANFGVLVDYEDFQDGKLKYKAPPTVDTELDLTGGDTLNIQAFMEFNTELHPNIAVLYEHVYRLEGTSTLGTSNDAGEKWLGVQLGGRYAFTESLELIPKITYTQMQDKPEDIDSANHFSVGAQLRIMM